MMIKLLKRINWKRILFWTVVFNVFALILGSALCLLSLLFPEGSPGILGSYLFGYLISIGIGVIGLVVLLTYGLLSWLEDWSN